jgi:hypothetical protein
MKLNLLTHPAPFDLKNPAFLFAYSYDASFRAGQRPDDTKAAHHSVAVLPAMGWTS